LQLVITWKMCWWQSQIPFLRLPVRWIGIFDLEKRYILFYGSLLRYCCSFRLISFLVIKCAQLWADFSFPHTYFSTVTKFKSRNVCIISNVLNILFYCYNLKYSHFFSMHFYYKLTCSFCSADWHKCRNKGKKPPPLSYK
jgi:hypothetical protein